MLASNRRYRRPPEYGAGMEVSDMISHVFLRYTKMLRGNQRGIGVVIHGLQLNG